MPSTVHAMQPANHSHAVLRIFLGCATASERARRKTSAGGPLILAACAVLF